MLLVSHDSKYLFSTNGSRIDVFSIASGELVYRLSNNETNQIAVKKTKVHQNESVIKSICINLSNKYQLLSFHLDGCICLWDYEDGLLLKTFESKLLIKKLIRTETNLYALGKLRSEFLNTITNSNKEIIESQQLALYKLQIDDSMKSHSQVEHQLIVSNLNLNEEKMLIEIDSESRYIAYVEGRKYLVVNQFKKNNNSLLNKFKAKLGLTCLAIHPNEDCIATGTDSGKIILWYNYLQQSTEDTMRDNGSRKTLKATKTVLHWHSLSVLSLCFTPEGSYLLSGGHECVLVKWMYRTGQPEFKPRLGAPLGEIVLAKDNTLYATQHLDNTIHLIGTNLNVQHTFCGFLSPKFSDSIKLVGTFYPTGLNYFCQLNCLITNGKPGHLQFYSYTFDKLLFNLDIVDENYISPENLNRPNVHTEIECVAFNYDSTWLVTIERRDDGSTTPETRLKFWQFDQANNKFSLNTLVRYPHAFEKVNKIKFKPNENVLFTCGNDGCFKSWILKENPAQVSSDSDETTFNWIYNSCDGYRDLNPTNIEFIPLNNSTDLVAVAFNHIVVVWQYDQYGMSFLNDLIHCDPDDHIKEMSFMNENLLVAHGNFLNVWNVMLPAPGALVKSPNDEVKFRCVWSHETNEVLYMKVNPVNESEILLFIKKTQKQLNEETSTEIQIATFNIHAKNIPALKTIHTFNVYSDSHLHFVCIKKSESEVNSRSSAIANKKSIEFENLLQKVNIFYCDNRGVLQKVLPKNKTTGAEISGDFNDLDLDDSLWINRKSLKKNLPMHNLSSIIDLHKSNKWDRNSHLIEYEKNEQFESNFIKIESTPAYLLPKVSSFCFDLLKSMLHRVDVDSTGFLKVGDRVKVKKLQRDQSVEDETSEDEMEQDEDEVDVQSNENLLKDPSDMQKTVVL